MALVAGVSLPTTVTYAETVPNLMSVIDKVEIVSGEAQDDRHRGFKTLTKVMEQKIVDTEDTTKAEKTPETDEESKDVVFTFFVTILKT